MMFQWLWKSILYVMGNVYVLVDKLVVYEVEKIAGVDIDMDFQRMSRQDLCNHLEKRFNLEENQFWNLPSTSKIRLGCQLGRNLRK
jgi:hypothetical protein